MLADEKLTENEPFVQRLQAEGAALGTHPIFLASRCASCRATARRRPAEWDHRPYHAAGSDNFGLTRIRAGYGAYRSGGAVRCRHAPIRLRRPASQADIPATHSLFELFGVRDVKELNVGERWRNSAQAGRSLATPIGMSGGGEPLIIDLHERVHGPNGLVAGMVGAGKSELLQTLVASLAVNYHPHRVAFALVDYKGGGMAKPFVGCPTRWASSPTCSRGTWPCVH